MTYLISLLIYLGVIGSAADYDPNQEAMYQECVNEHNIEMVSRSGDPIDTDTM